MGQVEKVPCSAAVSAVSKHLGMGETPMLRGSEFNPTQYQIV